MIITLVSPYDFAKPSAFLKLEPEAAIFFQIFPEAHQILKTKPRQKKTYQGLRQSTLAPDSVERVREMWGSGKDRSASPRGSQISGDKAPYIERYPPLS